MSTGSWPKILMFTCLALLAARSSWAETKLALLIGNRDYTENVGRLENPLNDIRVVGDALRTIGFTVTSLENAGFRDIRRAVGEYAAKVRAAGPGTVSVFYYAGHGAANADDGRNYLIPTDVDTADDTSLWSNSIDLQADVLDKLSQQAPDAIHYVVFDACRNELKLRIKGVRSLEPEEKGFNRLPDFGNFLIAFSTAPKRTASDGGAGVDNGPYARAFAEEVVKAGVEARTMFINVQTRVRQSVAQLPWLSMPPLPAIYLAGAGGGRAASPAAAQSRPLSQAEAFSLERASVQRSIGPIFDQLLADEGVLAGGAFHTELKWLTRSVAVCFLDGVPELNAAVATVARKWTLYGNIDFDFGDWANPRRCSSSGETSSVHLSYKGNGNWSYIGTQSRMVPTPMPTINLQSLRDVGASDVVAGKHDREILHEFGHVLGFDHNWAAPGANCSAEMDWEKVYIEFGKMRWPREMIDFNIRRPMEAHSFDTIGSFDRLSVMSYELPENLFKNGKKSPCFFAPSQNLSLRDKLAVYKYFGKLSR